MSKFGSSLHPESDDLTTSTTQHESGTHFESLAKTGGIHPDDGDGDGGGGSGGDGDGDGGGGGYGGGGYGGYGGYGGGYGQAAYVITPYEENLVYVSDATSSDGVLIDGEGGTAPANIDGYSGSTAPDNQSLQTQYQKQVFSNGGTQTITPVTGATVTDNGNGNYTVTNGALNVQDGDISINLNVTGGAYARVEDGGHHITIGNAGS